MGAFTIGPVMSNPPIVTAGGMVTVSAEFRNAAGDLAAPGTSITITLYDVTGAEAQASTAMTAGVTGKYSYAYASVTTKPPGEYTYLIACVDGGNTSQVRSKPGDTGNFTVE